MECHNVYSGMARAVERAHAAELNVGCSGGSLRRKLDGLPVRTSSAYQTTKIAYSSRTHAQGFLSGTAQAPAAGSFSPCPGPWVVILPDRDMGSL